MIDRGRLRRLYPLAAALAIALAYVPSLGAPFLFDDEPGILLNDRIRSLWPPWETVRIPARPEISPRPLSAYSFALSYAAGGGYDAAVFRAGNVAIHLLAALALYGLVRRTLSGSRAIPPPLQDAASEVALASALLWGLHPIGTSAVVYIVQRSEALVSLFYLLTLYCFARGALPGSRARVPGLGTRNPEPGTRMETDETRNGWMALSVCCCALGMMAKQVMVSAPIAALLFDRIFAGGSFREALRRRAFYAALFATGAITVLLAAGASAYDETSGGFGYQRTSMGTYLATQAGVLLHYARLAALPAGLSIDPGWPLASWREAAPALAAVGALLALAAWAAARGRTAGMAMAAFLLILAPTSSFMPLPDPAFDHRMYLPSACVVILAAAWAARDGSALRRAAPLGAVAAALLAWGTVARASDYRSGSRIWALAAARSPLHPRAHYNLGNELLAEGRAAQAAAAFLRATAADPEHALAWNNRGNALKDLGRMEHALVSYRKALSIDPRHVQALTNQGSALDTLGRTEEAVASYREALAASPRWPTAIHNLGWLLLREGETEEAESLFRRGLADRPADARLERGLAQALAASGRMEEGSAVLRRSLARFPDPAVRLDLGWILARLGRDREAMAQFALALGLSGADPDPETLLRRLAAVGRTEESEWVRRTSAPAKEGEE